jgi:hypothetical protein
MAVTRRCRLHGDIHRPDMAPGPHGRNVHRLRSRLESVAPNGSMTHGRGKDDANRALPERLACRHDLGKAVPPRALGGAEANDERRYVP